MFFYPDTTKPEKSMRSRIQAALRLGPAHGQLELGRRVFGEQYSLEDWRTFTEILKSMLMDPVEVIEDRKDCGGYFEYTYKALPEVKK